MKHMFEMERAWNVKKTCFWSICQIVDTKMVKLILSLNALSSQSGLSRKVDTEIRHENLKKWRYNRPGMKGSETTIKFYIRILPPDKHQWNS
jgi:hypothetical protein